MTFVCKFCESTEFNIVDGFYYCDECHRQNEQEFEFDAFGLGTEGALKKTKILDTSKSAKNFADKTQLTTWEAFNYILHGLVEELIAIGVNPEVKLTVFQMWTHYLRKTEVAFFNRENPALPRLPPIFSKRDADILYSHQRRAKKRRRSESVSSRRTPSVTSVPTNSQRRRKMTRLVDQSQFSEHLSELNDTKTDINKTLTSLADVSVSEIRTMTGSSEFGTGSNISSLAIEFSTFARSAFKNRVPKLHISKHSQDFEGDLKCHVIKVNDLGRDQYKLLSRKTLFGIIYCALNYHKEPLEIGDLMRFCREGHLSFSCARKYIPRNLSEKEIEELHRKYTFFKKNEVTLHTGWRRFVFEMQLFMRIQLEKPDLFALCRRYVEDLCLPEAIYTFAERILAFCPSEGLPKSYLPAFEARAMAIILLIFKLLFGIDGCSELEMSESAKNVNKHLERHERKFRLFVWSDWMEFIEARKSLLSQAHPPTFNNNPEKHDTSRFLQHIHAKSYQPDDESISEEPKDTKYIHTKAAQREESMLHFAKYISEADEKRDMKEIETNLIKFPPSLTPNRTYMELIREKYSDKFQISPVLLANHAQRDILALLDPVELQKELLCTRTTLELEETCVNNEIKFKRWINSKHEPAFMHYKKVDFDISKDLWEQKLREKRKKDENYEIIDEKDTHERKFTKFQRRKDLRRDPTVVENPENESLFGNDPPSELLEVDPKDYDEILTLKIPHFYYWSHFYYSYPTLVGIEMQLFDEISKDLPKNFIWLINVCAKMIEITPNELYAQLLVVENEFLFALKPMTKMKKKILYRKKRELPKKMATIIEHMKKIW